jgi:hypothetical protein
MKKIILFFVFSLLSISVNAQKELKDTSEICIPYSVAQKMLLDLNEFDRLTEISKLEKKEISELNNKIDLLVKVNETWVEKDSLNGQIILQTEAKVEIYKEENNNLNKENKKLRRKNTIFNIISGVIIVPLTYLVVFK